MYRPENGGFSGTETREQFFMIHDHIKKGALKMKLLIVSFCIAGVIAIVRKYRKSNGYHWLHED